MKKLTAILGVAFFACGMITAANYTKVYYQHLYNSLIDSTAIGSTTPSTGAFTTVSASGGITGSLTGNASTATALATTPTNCTASSQYATGVSASGNAVCGPVIQFTTNSTSCSISGDSFNTCTMTATWPKAFADTSYAAICVGTGVSDGSNTAPGRAIQNGMTSSTTTTVTFSFSQGGSAEVGYTGMSCIGMHS